ncbi:hypothetical protein KIPB_005403, partial [Kipferlia bialata]|eukprot:g5403.t1
MSYRPAPAMNSAQLQQMLTTYKYQNIQHTVSVFQFVMGRIPSLRPEAVQLPTQGGQPMPCACLGGTLPVRYGQNVFQIPVRIILLPQFPFAAPLCYVTPTPQMALVPSQQGGVMSFSPSPSLSLSLPLSLSLYIYIY